MNHRCPFDGLAFDEFRQLENHVGDAHAMTVDDAEQLVAKARRKLGAQEAVDAARALAFGTAYGELLLDEDRPRPAQRPGGYL